MFVKAEALISSPSVAPAGSPARCRVPPFSLWSDGRANQNMCLFFVLR